MGNKTLEYRISDLSFLKKEFRYRLLYLALFVAIFVWQLVLLIQRVHLSELTKTETIVGACTLVFSLVMFLLTLIYTFRCFSTISEVKKKSHAVRTVRTFSSRRKDTFLNLYSVVAKIITLVMVALFFSVLTYSVLEIIYYSTVSFYMPLAAFITVCGFNSVFHINFELTTVKEIREYNKLF